MRASGKERCACRPGPRGGDGGIAGDRRGDGREAVEIGARHFGAFFVVEVEPIDDHVASPVRWRRHAEQRGHRARQIDLIERTSLYAAPAQCLAHTRRWANGAAPAYPCHVCRNRWRRGHS